VHHHPGQWRGPLLPSPQALFPDGPPTGQVVIQSGNTTICTITLDNGRGSCNLTARQLAPGSYPLTAVYGGEDFTGSTSASTTLTVTP
jgi:hypothetical protein